MCQKYVFSKIKKDPLEISKSRGVGWSTLLEDLHWHTDRNSDSFVLVTDEDLSPDDDVVGQLVLQLLS